MINQTTCQHETIVMTTPSSADDFDLNVSGDDIKEKLKPLETVLELPATNNIEMNNLNEIPSTLQSPKSLNMTPVASVGPPVSTTHRQRNRTDSLRVITDKFRSISNDLLRSIESAHEMIDLNRSHFSAATQSAAAQQYQSSEAHLTPNANQQFSKWPKVKKEFLNNKSRSKTFGDSGDPASDLTFKSVDSPGNVNCNDLNSNLPSTSLSSYGLVNEQENVNKFYSLNRGDSMRDGKICDGDFNNANILSKHESTDNISTRENSFYYSPKNSAYNSPKFDNEKTLIGVKKTIRTIDETNAFNTSIFSNPSVGIKNNTNDSFIDKGKEICDEQFDSSSSNYIRDNNETTTTTGYRHNLIKKGGELSQRPDAGQDQVDFRVQKSPSKKIIPDDIHISILEVFIYLWGVVTFFADLISDIILSIEYFDNKRSWLGFMTLIFTIVPNVTLSLFSLSWYIDKYYQEKQLNLQKQSDPEQQSMSKREPRSSKISSTCDSITFWITTIFFVVFQLDLVWKYIQGFVYTLKGWACRSLFKNLKWEKYYIEKQIKCDTDIGMLRLIDVFMDSGPQVLLQLYVITTQNLNKLGIGNLVVFTFKDFRTTSLELKQLVSILSSLFSMGYALAGYHRCLRNQQFIFCLETNKPLPRPMSWLSTIMQFLWYLFLIAPRVLAMAIFASTFRSWFFMIIFTHWLIMYFWILRLKTNYCLTSQDEYNAREEIFEKFYNCICAFIYVFCYFNLKAGHTRLRYIIYYLIFYSENCLFCISYFLYSNETKFLYKLVMMLIVVFGFWIAITFQIVYYLYCHPSHNIQICVRKNSKFYFVYTEMLKPSHLVEESNLDGINQDDNDDDYEDMPRSPSQSQSDNDLRNIYNEQSTKLKTQVLSPASNVLQSISNTLNNSIYRKLSIRKKMNETTKKDDTEREEKSVDNYEKQVIKAVEASQTERVNSCSSLTNSSFTSSASLEEIGPSTSLLKSSKLKITPKKSVKNQNDENKDIDESHILKETNIESNRISSKNLKYPDFFSSFQSFSTYSSSLWPNHDKFNDTVSEKVICFSIPNLNQELQTKPFLEKISKDTLNKTDYDLNFSIESNCSPIKTKTSYKSENPFEINTKSFKRKANSLLKRTSSLNN